MRLHTARYSDMQRHGLGLGTWTGKMAWLLLALLCCVLSVKVQGQATISCYCTESDCVNNTCVVDSTSGRCELDVEVFPNNTVKEQLYYCAVEVTFVACETSEPLEGFTIYSQCCYKDDCNRCILPSTLPPQVLPYLTVQEGCSTPSFALPTPSPSPASGSGSLSVTHSTVSVEPEPTGNVRDSSLPSSKLSTELQAAIITLSAVLFFLVIVMVATILLYYRRSYKMKEQVDSIGNLPQFEAELDGATMSGSSGAGQTLLEPRTIAKQIKKKELIGTGRYGEVWLGEWNGEDVAIKIFSPLDENSWTREQLIYQTHMLYHENIAKFITVDEKATIWRVELWLVMEYHPNGSLYDYLQVRTLSATELYRLLLSVANGLQYLHLDVTAGQMEKPGIAHRDLKSRNILVKLDGSCCIADFGLAVRHNLSTGKVDQLPSNTRQGTKRYMAPEILDGTINAMMFESYRMVDIYCFGLVMWEVARRIEVNGETREYELPYYDMVSHDPSVEEMKKIVILEGSRPALDDRWKNDNSLSVLSSVMQECWRLNPSARLTAFRIKKKLAQLCTEGKNGYKH